MEKAEVYNNGHGWRISFRFMGAIRVLTLEEATELLHVIRNGLREVAMHVGGMKKKEE
jgi:hypothetical protein